MDRSSHSRVAVLGDDPNKRRNAVCLFASYQREGRVLPAVAYYVKTLAAYGFDIFFVQASDTAAKDSLPVDQSLVGLKPYCRKLVNRDNVGLDFASWQCGLSSIDDLMKYDHLLLANDSVVGPFRSLLPLFAAFDEDPGALWGLTDTCERGSRHLQSYFLYMSRELFSAPFFASFWRELVPLADKEAIINRYELGFSKAAEQAGFPVRALFPYGEVKAAALSRSRNFQYAAKLHTADLNPTLYAFDILLEDFGFPFIKADMFKTNRIHSTKIASWRRLVEGCEPDVVVAIEKTMDLFAEMAVAGAGPPGKSPIAHRFEQALDLLANLRQGDFGSVRVKISKKWRKLTGRR